jgi:dihydroxyacetone kinase-like predicted kinase
LLPNNKNIVPTAERVEELADPEIYIVPTTSIAAGLAVMVAYDAEGEPEDVVEEMREILSSLRVAEVTRAVRDARVDDREVAEGSYIGILDGALVSVDKSVEEAALSLAGEILSEGADLLTLLCGEALKESELEAILGGIHELYDEVEVAVRDGGQPLYPLQMVVE